MNKKIEFTQREIIKPIRTIKICEWCWSDLKEKHKAEYVIIHNGGKEYICKGHYVYCTELKNL
jgi:hypothetical protein